MHQGDNDMAALNYAKVKKFGKNSQLIIANANVICAEYAQQGYDLTLRQLYYQFVARGLIPNRDTEYKRLGSIINDARLAGLLDWDYIVDRTRNLRSNNHFNSPAHIVEVAARSYANDKWRDQPTRVEVWIEKDALIGVIEQVCRDNDVEHFSCRGYVSQSEMWSSAQRMFERAIDEKNPQGTVVLHLGDHDPSGIDMTRDIQDRLSNFFDWDFARRTRDRLVEADKAAYERAKEDGQPLTDDERAALYYEGWDDTTNDRVTITEAGRAEFRRANDEFLSQYSPVVQRIALTMDQVEEYDPPPNPAKLTDVRARDYCERYGDDSWELDALDPATLHALIEDSIIDHRDDDLWDEAVAREAQGRARLQRVVDEWQDEVA